MVPFRYPQDAEVCIVARRGSLAAWESGEQASPLTFAFATTYGLVEPFIRFS